ncbi:acyltransferase family protein [Ningiella sp. W23]|uniref:acyltransferase family protein n=1 Tax=Ningiella sp. W23 TaxID=3023715 RepID=UPI0037569D6A
MAINLLATIMVVAIHYNSKAFIDVSSGYGINYLLQEFFVNGISRIAVPIFALVSGFIIWEKLSTKNTYFSLLKTRIKSQLLPYLIASFFIFVSYSLITYVFKPQEFIPIDFNVILYRSVVSPLSPQLWFLRDLMFLVLLSPILLYREFFIHSALVCAFGALWLLNAQVFPIVGDYYLMNIETVFFFSLGGLLARKSLIVMWLLNLQKNAKLAVLTAWSSLILIRIYIDPTIDLWYVENYTLSSLLLYKLSIIIGLVAIFSLCKPLAFNRTVVYCSGLTFFVFMYHLVPLSYFRILTEKLFTKELSFFLNFPIALVCSFYAAHVTAKYFPKVFAVLSGGRNPDKALMRADALNKTSS